VLVVDDNPDVRNLISQVLAFAGYDVEEAGSGLVALRRLAEPDAPHIVILDVMMPDLDGWETLARLRDIPALADVRVILCTVKFGAADALRAWVVGSDGYVAKPFSSAELVAEIRSVESRSATERTVLRRQRLAAAQFASIQHS